MKTSITFLLMLVLAGCVVPNEMNFKFPTVGQAVVDAATVSQVLRGESLRPLPPVNLRGYRTPDGDLLIQWTRRSRIGAGLRPGANVPLSEELETYVVEIYDGATLKRTSQVYVDLGSPVIWEQTHGSPSDVTVLNDGTATGTSSGTVLRLKSKQKVYGNFMLEMTIPDTATYRLAYVGLDPTPQTPHYLWGAHGQTLTTVDVDMQGIPATTRTVATGDRITMEMRGGIVRYYRNYSSKVTPPFYTSGMLADPAQPFNIYCEFTASARSVVSPRLFTHLPESLYTAVEQNFDFGSAQSSIKVRVYQVSAIVGAGNYAEATL